MEDPETVSRDVVDVVPMDVRPCRLDVALTLKRSSSELSPKKVEPDVTRLPETIIVPAKTALAELDPETKNVVSEPDNCGFVKTMLPDIPITESLPYPEILLVIIGTGYLDSFLLYYTFFRRLV